MKLEVLGTGCAKCKTLLENVKKAVDISGKEAEIVKVEDIPSIMKYGVMSTPALVKDGKVLFSGKLATAEEIAGDALMRIVLTLFCLLLASNVFAELPSGNQLTIQAALTSGKPTIVDFGARSCIPCKKMAPILEQLEKEYKGRANVIFVDVWQDNKIGGSYRVQMIPTQIFFDAKGKEAGRHIGFMDHQPIIDTFTKLGVK